ncbi:MAG: hypothetical protein JSU07_00840 [Bacteroidetes bacterium]|nr:hypothetical protein [Bacteroidota bacterium]
MKKKLFFCLVVCINIFYAQLKIYKTITPTVIESISDSLNKCSFSKTDSLVYLKKTLNYCLSAFPLIRYNKIKIVAGKYNHPILSKPNFWAMFQSPDDRVYKIFISTETNSQLDSIVYSNLTLNAAVGLIAKEITRIKDFSTEGFFALFARSFKQLSQGAKQKIDKDIELKTIEAGLGYQLLNLITETNSKLKIENWKNSKHYKHYSKHIKNRHLSIDKIQGYIKEMPVYINK